MSKHAKKKQPVRLTIRGQVLLASFITGIVMSAFWIIVLAI